MKRILYAAIIMVCASACAPKGDWTSEESELITGQGDVMHVLTVENDEELAVLRTPCADLTKKEIDSELYTTLASKMLSTVTSPEQDGVGIAAPQVGLSRRVAAIQRFDKEGEPFEVYPNIRVIATRGDMEPGPEGCLSIPGRRGDVLRYRDIDIQYTSLATGKDTTERVQGFTAVIFQHETDHLDGVLFTDKLYEMQ